MIEIRALVLAGIEDGPGKAPLHPEWTRHVRAVDEAGAIALRARVSPRIRAHERSEHVDVVRLEIGFHFGRAWRRKRAHAQQKDRNSHEAAQHGAIDTGRGAMRRSKIALGRGREAVPQSRAEVAMTLRHPRRALATAMVAAVPVLFGARTDASDLARCLEEQPLARLARVRAPDGQPRWVRVIAASGGVPSLVAVLPHADDEGLGARSSARPSRSPTVPSALRSPPTTRRSESARPSRSRRPISTQSGP